jgi:uncharacterized protein (TIGR03086 family)
MTTTPLSPSTGTDPRPAFFAAAQLACDTVAGVSPARLADPTPCTEFDVRALLGHLVAVLRRITSVASGAPAVGHPPLVTDVPDDGWAASARAALADVEAAWSDPAVLAREIRLPFGTLPGAAALASYTGELSTHTWDLAVATGQSPRWDEQVLTGALAAIHAKLPTAGRPPGVPFGDAFPVADDAPVIDRLVAWQGRDPQWRPGDDS